LKAGIVKIAPRPSASGGELTGKESPAALFKPAGATPAGVFD
jgi:hypothetical protein